MLNQPGLPGVLRELRTWTLFQSNPESLQTFCEIFVLKEMLARARLTIHSLCSRNGTGNKKARPRNPFQKAIHTFYCPNSLREAPGQGEPPGAAAQVGLGRRPEGLAGVKGKLRLRPVSPSRNPSAPGRLLQRLPPRCPAVGAVSRALPSRGSPRQPQLPRPH